MLPVTATRTTRPRATNFSSKQIRSLTCTIAAIAFVGQAAACGGTVTATTDKGFYRVGDTMRIEVYNRSNHDLWIPEITQHLTFVRRQGEGWFPVRDRQAADSENAVVNFLPPGHKRELVARVWPELSAGEYRITFDHAWSTNSFMVGQVADASTDGG